MITMKKILKNITKDKIVKKASKYYPRLRITRQDPFQCCISFIISANSNIPNIRMRLQKLCMKFGTKVRFQKREFFLFPEPKRLASATLQELKECKLGYRAKYVLDTSRIIASGEIDFIYTLNLKIPIMNFKSFCVICFFRFHCHSFWSHECFGWRNLIVQ